jgi:predicted RNA-binding protein (TIGR00451 family)
LRDRYEFLEKIRRIAEYQLGRGAGKALFPDNVEVVFSKSTGRIRHIRLGHELLATLRPTDGMFSLTIEGAKRLKRADSAHYWVTVTKDAGPFVMSGKSVFAKHVLDADTAICPQDEVIVLDKGGNLLAVGKAILTGNEMKLFKKGLAVRIRRGVLKGNQESRQQSSKYIDRPAI